MVICLCLKTHFNYFFDIKRENILNFVPLIIGVSKDLWQDITRRKAPEQRSKSEAIKKQVILR